MKIGVLALQDVASTLKLYSLDGESSTEISLPGLGSAGGLVGRLDRPEILYEFQSASQPVTAYVYDASSGASTPFNPPRLTFDESQFVTERVFFTSRDGTRVPMFITHLRSMRKSGANPTLLHGYGGFSISIRPAFSPEVIAWVEQGGVFAVANIRGGGEYGEAWHTAGQFGKKQRRGADRSEMAKVAAERFHASEKIEHVSGDGEALHRFGDFPAADQEPARAEAERARDGIHRMHAHEVRNEDPVTDVANELRQRGGDGSGECFGCGRHGCASTCATSDLKLTSTACWCGSPRLCA